MRRLIDILLLPKDLFRRISGSKATLVLGMLLVGAVDLVFPYILDSYNGLYTGKPQWMLSLNIALTAVFIIILGLVDVLFFSLPLFDLFKIFRKEEENIYNHNQLIKLMKVYIVSHFLVIPLNLISYYIFRNTDANYPLAIFWAYFSVLVVPIWLSGVIARGINELYRFHPFFKRVVLLAVFAWSYLLSFALEYMINNWIIKLFKV